VVCAPSRGESIGALPAANLESGPSIISGGERSLYELATAAAVAGFTVELRGDLNAAILTTITDSAGAAPEYPSESRRPGSGDIVIFPEAYDLKRVAGIHLSGASGVVYALAPPGLFGWSYRSGWVLPNPSTVPLEQVGRGESFRAISALGLSVWTNAHGIAEVAQVAGIPVTWLGTGTPVPFPSAAAKIFDLAVVEANRWRVWSDQIVAGLPEFSVLHIPERASTYSLCVDLAGARVLVWPSRVEGMSRISREARAVGTVPVALDTNPFATKEDHGDGVVLVPDLTTLEHEARRLLQSPAELADLSAQGMRGAREQADWGSFVARVAAAIVAVKDRPDGEARSELGDLLEARELHLTGLITHHESVVEDLRSSVERLESSVHDHLERLTVQEAKLEEQASAMKRENRALEISDRNMARAHRRLEESLVEVAEARTEVAAFRSRRIVRLLDRLVAIRRRSAAPKGAPRQDG
jgi:hypothetical protein